MYDGNNEYDGNNDGSKHAIPIKCQCNDGETKKFNTVYDVKGKI